MFSFLSLVQAFPDRFSNPTTPLHPTQCRSFIQSVGRSLSRLVCLSLGCYCCSVLWYLYGLAFTSVCQSQSCIKYNCNIEMLLLIQLKQCACFSLSSDIVCPVCVLFVHRVYIWMWLYGVCMCECVCVCFFREGGNEGFVRDCVFTFKSILVVYV